MTLRTPIKLLAAGIAAACLTSVAQAADIKFGFAAPLTGPQSHYGEDMQNGLTLALEEANQKGVQVDGKPAKFVLVSRDDQADARVAVQVAQQLVDQDVNGILGHFNSGTTIPASRIYHDAGLPQIAMATSPEYTKQGYETTFRMMTSDTQQGGAVGKFMVEKLNAKKIALIDDRTAYGQGLADEVEKAVKAAGGQIVRREYTTDKANDFTSILTNIKGVAPDAIFYGGLDAQSGPMKRQMVTLGLKAPLVSGEMTRSDTFIKLAGDAADGTYASLAGVPLDKMSAGKDFEQRYQARFKKAPGVYAPYAYDGAWNMITAIEKAGSAKPEKYLPQLAKLNRKGATSEHIAYDDKGDLKEISVTIYQVKNGKWEMVETMVSQAQ
ncbi:branched-chain amino acid ABC transporter substrate-binding protein [Bordetella pseudohinzii]|uniref:Branched chain amino acid ABC transporter substrate-binding protein n=1 Tax=Bordetella pseudohinzii TaxID=1331258 RepID=A0A0J6C1Z8_9BORD|nr:branched-chain amino acid ABC transporter substrate-binding protein [Bordetella pseudohinzii]ANY15836.1 branched chain amino acid ABC transporter substrate-binding protein [Bordetella pseudohinzii]KMM25068.1 amino acid ABC transporter substrate-binding protein [Bordetella pseudohinzii]KXA80344.1 branched chain amino acid ABC transporter substrate-binding protein [Bordetella pseudohinzii]KXA81402.1 branched chain amino acid ABC transporter substrate-binding protein [Bordetella pseudohinzii]C